MKYKKCPKCGKTKETKNFRKNRTQADGLQVYCKPCQNLSNKKSVRKYYARWRQANRTQLRKTSRKWRQENPEKAKASQRKSYAKRIKNPAVRLNYAIRSAIRYSLRKGGKSSKTFEMLGFTIDELKQHLQNQFEPQMNWANYGLWQIDHKTPIAAFSFDNWQDADFKKCWALENLQPLWAKDNRIKSARL